MISHIVLMFEGFLAEFALINGGFGMGQDHVPFHVRSLFRSFATKGAFYDRLSNFVKSIGKKLEDIICKIIFRKEDQKAYS